MKDRVIAVNGAFGYLGSAVVDELKKSGVIVAAIDIAEGKSAADMVFNGVDAQDPDAATQCLSKIVSEHGALEGLVNVAGGFAWETVLDGSLETWDRMYSVNVRTAVAMCKAAAPLLDGNGAIVNVGAAAAVRAGAGMGAYAAAKSGVARLTEALAAETIDSGVRVNAVLPSIIDTAANRATMPCADFDKWVKPSDVAKVVAFLLSDSASAVTGALLPVTGRL